ncbi:MAG: hypothetical protein ACREDM_17110, partial [Methylocella sp.]
ATCTERKFGAGALSQPSGLAKPAFNNEDAARAHFEVTRGPESKLVCLRIAAPSIRLVPWNGACGETP